MAGWKDREERVPVGREIFHDHVLHHQVCVCVKSSCDLLTTCSLLLSAFVINAHRSVDLQNRGTLLQRAQSEKWIQHGCVCVCVCVRVGVPENSKFCGNMSRTHI